MTERRLTAKGLATKERIVAAASALIATKGVAGTSIEDVRDAASVSSSQLYHYFENKRALVSAVITRQADAVGGVPDLGPLDSFEALRAWADAAVERQELEQGQPHCDLSGLAGELSGIDEDARAVLASGFLRWKDTLVSGLRTMRGRGELRTESDPEELALALLTALQGGQLMTQTLRSTAGLRAAMNAALAYVHSFAR